MNAAEITALALSIPAGLVALTLGIRAEIRSKELPPPARVSRAERPAMQDGVASQFEGESN